LLVRRHVVVVQPVVRHHSVRPVQHRLAAGAGSRGLGFFLTGRFGL
jgi:hypothetical protein